MKVIVKGIVQREIPSNKGKPLRRLGNVTKEVLEHQATMPKLGANGGLQRAI